MCSAPAVRTSWTPRSPRATSAVPEADARREDLHLELTLQDKRDLVFLFRFRMEAIPVHGLSDRLLMIDG